MLGKDRFLKAVDHYSEVKQDGHNVSQNKRKSIQRSNRVVQCQPAKQVTLARLIPVVVQSGQSEDCHWIAWGLYISRTWTVCRFELCY